MDRAPGSAPPEGILRNCSGELAIWQRQEQPLAANPLAIGTELPVVTWPA